MKTFVYSIHLFVILTPLLWSPFIWAGPLQQVTVFQQGEGGYHTFRIPAVVAAADGTLLAFAEGRVNGSGDAGNIDIVLKRSSDGGATWSALQVVQEEGGSELITIGNPAPVLDETTGRLWLTFCRNNSRVFTTYSDDHGQSWSARQEITSSVKPAGWTWYATGPVHGIQLTRGPHAGRLIIPCDHNTSTAKYAHVIYSDDHGATWQVGGDVPSQGDMGPNESTIVELTSGDLYFNIRNQAKTTKARIISYSDDGGQSFGTASYDMTLIDPVVQASVLRYTATDQGDDINRLLFSNPAHTTSRVRMTIRSSFDESATWTAGKLVYRGPSGYSDLVKITTSGGGGLLYENGTSAYYNRISFARYDTQWLDDPSLVQIDFRDDTAKDQRGNGLDGSIEGGASFISGDPRFASGHALHFDGQDDIVRMADNGNNACDFDAADSFTLEAVFRTSDHTDGGANGSGPLIAKDVGANQQSFWLRVENGNLRFLTCDGPTTSDVISSSSISDGQWHHVAAVLDRVSGQMRLYVDYQLVDTETTIVTGSVANTNDLLIGSFNASSPGLKRFIGDIDLARISMGALSVGQFVQPKAILGDANGDGQVNLADLQVLGDHWQAGDAYWLVGDFSGDGVVNLADLQILGDNWGYGADLNMSFDRALQQLDLSVPEPATLLLLAGMGALCLPRRTRSFGR
ncbi:MAG: exo-alpha-sialidase [Phycisphaeraceae bacterium]|nr:exo-alpha-sialidase [Phycisphaeraceae bacterium]